MRFLPLALIIILAGMLLGQTTSPAMKSSYVYLGKPVTEAWMKAQYNKFGDKIAKVGNNYFDIGETTAAASIPNRGIEAISGSPPKVGSLRFGGGGKIVDTRGKNSAIVQFLDVAVFVAGIPEEKNLVSSNTNQLKLIYTGPHEIDRQNMQGYQVYKPLTFDDFSDAIRSGFILIDYRIVVEHTTQRVATGSGFAVTQGRPQRVDVYHIEQINVKP